MNKQVVILFLIF